MNNEQINNAARKYCEIVGQDPDEMVEAKLTDTGVSMMTTRWSLAADKIIEMDHIIQAVDFVLGGKDD